MREAICDICGKGAEITEQSMAEMDLFQDEYGVQCSCYQCRNDVALAYQTEANRLASELEAVRVGNIEKLALYKAGLVPARNRKEVEQIDFQIASHEKFIESLNKQKEDLAKAEVEAEKEKEEGVEAIGPTRGGL